MSEHSTDERYRRFAEYEARGYSETYERLALAIADDPELLATLDRLEWDKRQPNLLFAAVRFHDGPIADPDEFRHWLLLNWATVSRTMQTRRTQTNEVGRCATLLPVLNRIVREAGGNVPLSLIEVGASAGLCLYPDRVQYSYDGAEPIGDPASPVHLECDTGGLLTPPTEVPRVAWRAGVDLNPGDVTDAEAMRWLECLIWPGRPERVERLRGAIELARAEPPELVAGDLVDRLPELVARAPAGSIPVVFHSAVLIYLPPERRRAFGELIGSLPVRWVSNEGETVLDDICGRRSDDGSQQPDLGAGSFELALDGEPVAATAGHGHWIRPLRSDRGGAGGLASHPQ